MGILDPVFRKEVTSMAETDKGFTDGRIRESQNGSGCKGP